MQIIYEIEDFEVAFTSYPYWEDDSFSYAGTHCTGGKSGIQSSTAYATLEDQAITWNKSIFSDYANEIIENWLADKKNYDDLEDSFLTRFVNEQRQP